MYTRPEQLLEKYPLTVKSFSKGRDCYLCDSSLGMVALHEYHGSLERADFLARMLSHLKQSGLFVEEIISSTAGEVLVTDEEERKFLLTEAYAGAECDVKKEEDMLLAVKMLAVLHNHADSFPGEVPQMLARNLSPLSELYEKHNRELRQVKNYIRGRKKKNAFEALFLQQYEVFYQKAASVTKQLSAVPLSDELYGFCHGDYNQHSIVFAKQGIAVVGLERFGYDLRMRDLANFIRKMMEKNDWNTALGKKLLKTYEKERALKEKEAECLYLFLSYPEKFWKLANHYHQVHKPWLSERNVEKLRKVILQEKQREKFLEELSHSLFTFHLL